MEVTISWKSIPEKQRIIADNGNYDCDLQSCRMEYGKHYVAYVQGKVTAGNSYTGRIGTDGVQKSWKNTGKNSFRATAQAAETWDLITIPETVRVLLTQDHGQKVFRERCLECMYWEVPHGKHLLPVWRRMCCSWKQHADCGTWMAQNGVDEAACGSDQMAVQVEVMTDAGWKQFRGAYAGKLHIYRKADGNTYWIVNELGNGRHISAVWCLGRCHASFAPEALKAQAVCARTYAALQVLGTAYEMYHADVDDTTDCQVYLPENANAAATEAVYATAGQILTWQGMIASIYYFSTSCGYTTGLEVWQQEALPYLGVHSLVQNEGMGSSADIFLRDGQVTAYDSESRFFRWRAVLQLAGNEQKLRHALQTAASHRDGKVVLTDGAGVQTENLTSFGIASGSWH